MRLVSLISSVKLETTIALQAKFENLDTGMVARMLR